MIRACLIKPIEPHAGVIYYRLFKHTQQHTAGLQRTIGTPPPKAGPEYDYGFRLI